MSTATDSLQAADPAHNASVHASAGTGKTWLLVTRIVRLLLDGTAPDSILAITFTRKAAAEMQQRLTERLRELMSAPPDRLDEMLQEYGATRDDATRARARHLYEESLFNPYTLRATTFHAFCQELLQRFPLEAGVAPGFELIETSGLQEKAAMDALVAETARAPHGALAGALETLVEGCESLDGARTALDSFLTHRSDWWAYVEGMPDAYARASERLTALLGIAPGDDPLQGFPDAQLHTRLQTYSALLEKNPTKTNIERAGMINHALENTQPAEDMYASLIKAIFTGGGTPRKYKDGPTLLKKLGESGRQLFFDLHATLAGTLDEVRARRARARTLETNLAWYTAGMRLLEHYQRIKQEQRLLDFADLEWLACRLLNRSDHASWVQYKLDSRIDHLLVDEFQDTNPTQWRLLLPLLEELAATDDGRARSVFLVGDRKQSIYGFRRANPALLEAASGWMEARLAANRYPLDSSRRSAQAIIDAVNTVFGTDPLAQHISEFNRHTTHHPDVYGRVEILPLVCAPETDAPALEPAGLRNPLETPRSNDKDSLHAQEGRLVAAQIGELVGAGTRVLKDGTVRTLDYGDIIILLRRRTHATRYEQALREAGIPYSSASRGELLDNLEIRDLEALLKLLISPYANLDLAQVLRSPLFNLESEHLLPLARHDDKTWYERLGALAAEGHPVFGEIHAMLERWRALTGKLPVHDLLDRIYHEADLVARYRAAFPPQLRSRVEASLTRFIELALELDNGRYPSLPYFLDRLARLRQTSRDQPDEGTPDDGDGRRVRLLTIHGAKGLEAPVIFLADAAAVVQDRSANAALVDWPPGEEAPRDFLLIAKKTLQDPVSQALLEERQREEQRENANLLYVAMTRARQYLFVSGSEGKASQQANWYEMLHAAVSGWEKNSAGHLYHESGNPPDVAATAPAPPPAAASDPRLSAVIPSGHAAGGHIAPSRTQGGGRQPGTDSDGRERGIAIHAMLEWLTEPDNAGIDVLPAELANRLGRATENPELQDWWEEALRTVRDPALEPLFDGRRYNQAMNEVPVQYMESDRLVFGIIDRVLLRDDSVLVIDYKTHRTCEDAELAKLARDYRDQMHHYGEAAARLWPGRSIDTRLLFTHSGTLLVAGETHEGG